MRYPIWMFLFVFVIPPFTLHAVLVGKAGFAPRPENTLIIRPAATAPLSASITISPRAPIAAVIMR